MAETFDPRIDPNHPVFLPRPVRVEGEDGLDYKMRIQRWEKAKKKRQPIPKSVRRAVFARDGNCCVACCSGDDLAVDHIYPWSLGGADKMINFQTLCQTCNSRKLDSVPGDI